MIEFKYSSGWKPHKIKELPQKVKDELKLLSMYPLERTINGIPESQYYYNLPPDARERRM